MKDPVRKASEIFVKILFINNYRSHSKVLNVGWAQTQWDLKYWVCTTTDSLLFVQNIGWPHAIVPPKGLVPTWAGIHNYGPITKGQQTHF